MTCKSNLYSIKNRFCKYYRDRYYVYIDRKSSFILEFLNTARLVMYIHYWFIKRCIEKPKVFHSKVIQSTALLTYIQQRKKKLIVKQNEGEKLR
jgi:hypothetical protein